MKRRVDYELRYEMLPEMVAEVETALARAHRLPGHRPESPERKPRLAAPSATQLGALWRLRENRGETAASRCFWSKLSSPAIVCGIFRVQTRVVHYSQYEIS